MKLYEIVSLFDGLANFSLQESYDNSGIQIGNPKMDIHSALVTLDVTPDVIDEAIASGVNLVISHHPLIFKGIKSLTDKNSIEVIIRKAIKNDISILSVHTNLDAVMNGVNSKICDKLGLEQRQVLQPMQGRLVKLVFFVPSEYAEEVREAVFEAGAGVIGNYDSCSYNVNGTGSFRAGDHTNPFVGEKGKLHLEKEVRVETILPEYLKHPVLKALLDKHPYEEVAYDFYPLQNEFNVLGMGMTGFLTEETGEMEFLRKVKSLFHCGCVKYTGLLNKKIKKVAVCGGSGSFLIRDAIASGADIFITGDIKYHDFFNAEGKILIADIGHFESEQFTKELFYEFLTEKIPNFAVHLSKVNTNPINYL